MDHDHATATTPPSKYGWVVVAIFLLALAVRALFLASAEVAVPIRGDIIEYWHYAWNLAQHGVFSRSDPAAAVLVPDSYRGPGYPAFLAISVWLADGPEQALRYAQWSQVLLGAALAPLTILLARRWLSAGWALFAGVLVALWPHLVVFSSTLLSETAFAAALLLALIAYAKAEADARLRWSLLGGLAAGAAWLVNPIALLLPLLLALLLAWRRHARRALCYALAFLLVVGGWSARTAGTHTGSSGSRAAIAFVQGAWPDFFAAYNDRDRNEIANAIYQQVIEESNLAAEQPRAAVATVAARFRAQPGTYLRWYALQKPWLLWSWNIPVGWGDVYFLETEYSPFERNAGLRAIHAIFRFANPWLFAAALLAALAVAVLALRRREGPPAALCAVAALFLYVTLVHAVLLADPRYAVAYRPFEVLLALSSFAWVADRIRVRRQVQA